MGEVFNSFFWWDYAAIFLIFVFGLPHGAFDAAVGISIGIYNDIKQKFIFLLTYVSLSALIVILWFLFPWQILVIFLFTSIFHFGLGDTPRLHSKLSYYISGYFKGGLIIFGISFCNISEVDILYFILIGNSTDLIWQFLKIGLTLWFFVIPIHLYLSRRNFNKKNFLNYSTLVLIILSLPPLMAFAAYFCFIHSFNHIKRIIPALQLSQSKKSIFKIFIIFSISSWMIGLVVLLVLTQNYSLSESLLRLTFIGLAALTFPHMILVDMIFRPRLKI